MLGRLLVLACTASAARADGDGIVSPVDSVLWRIGATGGLVAPAPQPEPSGLPLDLGIGTVFVGDGPPQYVFATETSALFIDPSQLQYTECWTGPSCVDANGQQHSCCGVVQTDIDLVHPLDSSFYLFDTSLYDTPVGECQGTFLLSFQERLQALLIRIESQNLAAECRYTYSGGWSGGISYYDENLDSLVCSFQGDGSVRCQIVGNGMVFDIDRDPDRTWRLGCGYRLPEALQLRLNAIVRPDGRFGCAATLDYFPTDHCGLLLDGYYDGSEFGCMLWGLWRY